MMTTKLTVILALFAILSGTVQAGEKNGRFKGVIAGATFDVAVECYVGESVNHKDMIRFVTNSGMSGEKNEDGILVSGVVSPSMSHSMLTVDGQGIKKRMLMSKKHLKVDGKKAEFKKTMKNKSGETYDVEFTLVCN